MPSLFDADADIHVIAGHLRGAIGRVQSVDEIGQTAYVRLWLNRVDGSIRRALAVVDLGDIELLSERPRYEEPPRARRGRPRTIGDDTIRAIHELHASGMYSHANIAGRVGVSKSSVTAILRRERDEQPPPKL